MRVSLGIKKNEVSICNGSKEGLRFSRYATLLSGCKTVERIDNRTGNGKLVSIYFIGNNRQMKAYTGNYAPYPYSGITSTGEVNFYCKDQAQ